LPAFPTDNQITGGAILRYNSVMPDDMSMSYADLHEEARRGIALFNQRAYFDAHEALEAPGALNQVRYGRCTREFCRSAWRITISRRITIAVP
jgi:hypothetical protein